MIGIILLVLLCVKSAQIAKQRGRTATGFIWMTIGLWIGGAIVGFLLGALCSYSLTNDVAVVAVTLGCAFLFEIGGGVGAYFITKNCKPGSAVPSGAEARTPASGAAAIIVPHIEVQGSTTRCASCGEPVPGSAKFCTNCGTNASHTVCAPAATGGSTVSERVSAEPMTKSVACVVSPETVAEERCPVPETVAEAACPVPETVLEQSHTASKMVAEASQVEPADAAAHGLNRSVKRLWLFLSGAAVALALILVLVINGAKKKNYEAAIALFDAGGYAEAASAFDAMGSYEDSMERAALCRQWETYTHASSLAETDDSGKLSEAETLFRSLGTFEDAAQQAVQCRNRVEYGAALTLEQEARYEEALVAFTALGEFSDAKAHARSCSDTLDYAAAMTLIEAGDYVAAADKLAAPAESGFSDAADQLALCSNKKALAAAEQLLAEGNFYEAYRAFIQLGTFEGASQRAQSCVQTLPANGEIYHNDAYKKQSTHLKVVNSSATPSFLKLYSASGDLVCSFFIRANKSVTVKVPAGTYSLNQAYGSQWFGPDDMFGDDGNYYKCNIEGSYIFTMQSGYIYTISQGSGGSPVTNSGTERGTF